MNQSRRGGRALSLPQWEMMPQLRTLENLMGRLFDDGEEGWFGGGMIPSVDLSETDKSVDVRVDLPGMKAEEIDIQVHNNLLTIRGERKEESEALVRRCARCGTKQQEKHEQRIPEIDLHSSPLSRDHPSVSCSKDSPSPLGL